MKQHNINYSSNYGEGVVRQADVLASCYLVNSSASLQGLHYCTTSLTGKLPPPPPNSIAISFGETLVPMKAPADTLPQGPSGIPEVPSTGLPSPPSSPPLAAITSTNQLALTPKTKSRTDGSWGGRNGNGSPRPRRRGGATSRIREECERFFCETLRAIFLGERNLAAHGAILTDVINYNNYHNRNHHNYNGTGNDAGGIIAANDPLTPPEHFPITDQSPMASRAAGADTGNVSAWLEVYDYAGGTSFRAFVSEDTEIKSLFVFFDAGVLGRDLKQA